MKQTDADYFLFLTQWGREKRGGWNGLWDWMLANYCLKPPQWHDSVGVGGRKEFRDNLSLWYSLKPLDMPYLCFGCVAKMTVEHALQCQCKVGGLVHCRHDDVNGNWLLMQASLYYWRC